MDDFPPPDDRIPRYIAAAEQMKQGQFDLEVPTTPPDEIGRLGAALRDLARALETRYREVQQLERITARINAGLLLDDVLDNVFQDFREVIPYDRIGLALLEENGQQVRARWARSDLPVLKINRNFTQPLAGSSLEVDPAYRGRGPEIVVDVPVDRQRRADWLYLFFQRPHSRLRRRPR
jgi:hypothetical protein